MHTLTDLPLLDIETLEELKQDMPNNFSRALNFYLEDSATYNQQIRDGILHNQLKDVIRASHTLKSSSAHMGALKLSSLAQELEEKAREIEKRNGVLESLAYKLPELENVLMQTHYAFLCYK